MPEQTENRSQENRSQENRSQENRSVENRFVEEMRRIYGDTNYFIDAITKEYGFYGFFIDAMRAGNASMNITRRAIHKTIEEQWMSAIEACIPAIDLVTRNGSINIEEREEVLPIELSRNINNRSLRHLSQHTDYISKIEGDKITPSKILNVFHEETMQTYENKFVNTLIHRLYAFVDKRYLALAGRGMDEAGVGLEFDSTFQFGSSEGKLSLKIEVSDPVSGENNIAPFLRLTQLREVLASYLNSSFAKTMGNSFIRPPVMRTNAISKNKYLRECLDLWDYIETYEKLGYLIETEEHAEKPGDALIKEIYSLMSLQYMMFDYNIHHGFEDMPEVVASKQSDEPLTPEIVTHFQKVETKDRNAYPTEYRKVVNISGARSKRPLPAGETQIRNAIEVALAADREMDLFERQNARNAKSASGAQKS